jgi:hypothetical protein
MTELEPRLRRHFAGAQFQLRPEWEARLQRELSAQSTMSTDRVGAARGPAARASGTGRHRAVAAFALFAALALLAAITAAPGIATTDVPPWAAGLRSAIRIDTSGGGRASSWGYTLDLIGAYADDQRTIVVLKGGTGGSPVAIYGGSLTAAGQRLGFQQSMSGDDGLYAVKFPPLAPRSSPTSATLHLVGGYLPPLSWTLTFSVNPDLPLAGTVPLPGQAGRLAITFSRVRAVPGALAIRFTETGASYGELFRPASPPNTDPRTGWTMQVSEVLMHVQVFDANRKPLRWLDSRIDPTADGVTFDEVSLRTGPGPYRVVITAPDGGTLERTIQV